jgi:hypothetical protein
VPEEFFETVARFEEARVTGIDHPIVPLQSVLQRLAADVAGADECGARH